MTTTKLKTKKQPVKAASLAKTDNRVVKVRVPATSANLGPGFDVLGLSLALYENYRFRRSNKRSLSISGLQSELLSVGQDNLVFKVANILGRIKGERLIFSAEVQRAIPLSMGLGSSSAAIVASLVGLNELFGIGLSKDELFGIAAKIEGHPDNVAPAVYGGLTISWQEKNKFKAFSLRLSRTLTAFIFLPSYELSTKKARAILRTTVKRSEAVHNISRTALITALLTRNTVGTHADTLKEAFSDKLHQDQRQRLLPGFKELTEELGKLEILGSALSGAGPSIIVFAQKTSEKAISTKVDKILKRTGLDYSYFAVDLDLHGCKLTR